MQSRDPPSVVSDILGEHQLIYEQYNSILFFICYCIHHFGRQVCLDDPDGPGFVRTWLREFSKAKWLDMLSDEDSNAIGVWITALFDGDGISDELVRYFVLTLGEIFLFCAKLLVVVLIVGGCLIGFVGILCNAIPLV